VIDYSFCLHFTRISRSSNTAGAESSSCSPADAAALLQLKQSFVDLKDLTSWRAKTDCCLWEAVACDATSSSGRVIALDLGGRNLRSRRGLHPALFDLTSLRNLSLRGNDFMGESLPSTGFELLSEMVHLDIADTNFSGQIPIGVARLSKLVHLSAGAGGPSSSRLVLKEPSFETLVANLGNLRELRLHGVDISIGGRETWSVALASSTPDLQILSLSSCGLSGPIHRSFSRLRSLVEISLPGNRIAGKVPEFLAGFSSLTTLDLRDNDFERQFPAKVFRLKNLKVLLVSGNSRLSGHLVSFPVENRLEMLDLKGTNFSDGFPASIVNLKSLSYLTLTTQGTSKHLPFVGKLPSLGTLVLQGSSSGLQKPQFSWIGDLTHLTSLLIDNYNFSEPIPSWIGNLTELMSLRLSMCSLYGPIPPWIGNLTQLSSIDFTGNYLTGELHNEFYSTIISSLSVLKYSTTVSYKQFKAIPSSRVKFLVLTIYSLLLKKSAHLGSLKTSCALIFLDHAKGLRVFVLR
jgi:Leucine-rich repeat (LRR) protein